MPRLPGLRTANRREGRIKMKAKFQETEHHEFAKAAWHLGDVQTLRPNWSDAQCYNFLVNNGKYLQEAMVLAGWEAMDELLGEE